MTFLAKNKQIILYSLALAGFIFLIRWFEIRYILEDDGLNTYIGVIALLFTGLGI